jgi:hypothetical protein
MARVSRGVPRGRGQLLFYELPDGTRGALPSWMTDAAACAALTGGPPVVGIAALQELWLLLDAVGARGSVPTDASMPSKEGCDAPKESVDPQTDTAVPARRHELRVELAAPQQQELIRALAELLLDARGRANGAERDAQ